MEIKRILIYFANKLGFEVYKLPGRYHKQKLKLFSNFNINCILDVGANKGQFAENHLKYGYLGKVISFEPIKSVFDILESKAKNNSRWKCMNYALGEVDGNTSINISENTESSSILPINTLHTEAAPRAKFINKEEIILHKLDTIFDVLINNNENVFLKIDAQGYEMNILKGAKNSLQKIVGIQIELSLIELYENEILFEEMITFLKQNGFVLYGIEPGFTDTRTGRLLQMDGIFFKEKI